ncbi:unnamed protein product [Allacma fusca]|uniref:Uncharacterized protein n=1 Tax=Allacma fusca TaxID=39272 RepID=A0A8J2KDY2_9HEXA|nr:unnamed protein product [Allacma fusca]
MKETLFGDMKDLAKDKQMDFENGVFTTVLQNYVAINFASFYSELAALKNLEEKFKHILNTLRPVYPDLSEEELLRHILRYKQRLEAAGAYECGGKVIVLQLLLLFAGVSGVPVMWQFYHPTTVKPFVAYDKNDTSPHYVQPVQVIDDGFL